MVGFWSNPPLGLTLNTVSLNQIINNYQIDATVICRQFVTDCCLFVIPSSYKKTKVKLLRHNPFSHVDLWKHPLFMVSQLVQKMGIAECIESFWSSPSARMSVHPCHVWFSLMGALHIAKDNIYFASALDRIWKFDNSSSYYSQCTCWLCLH